MKPKTVDMGTTHFTHAELVEFDDPSADKYPNGLTIHVIQCCECGAHTNDGIAENIPHYDSCTPGESDKWEKHYADMPTDEELEEEYAL